MSNVKEIQKELCTSSDNLSQVKEILSSEGQESHVLGLKWDHVLDTLVVSRGVIRELKDTVTQRTVLSFVSSVFDPIGLVAPYTVRARLLLKEIWRISGQQWNNPLPLDLNAKLLEWRSGLPILGQLIIPRCYFPSAVDKIKLHMFGDSSQEVFCAVGFLRARIIDTHETKLAFILGKARVAPMKAISIPKLELQASLLATRLKIDIMKALSIPINDVFMWTDSTTVLQWLHSTAKQPVFVANRVGEILEVTTVDEWYHVDTENNPADTGTRGIAAEALKDSSWTQGPRFLRTSDWPFRPNVDVITKKLKGPIDDVIDTATNFVINPSVPEPVIKWKRYNSFLKLLRVVAIILRLNPKFNHFRGTIANIVKPSEIDNSQQMLFLLSQKEAFPSEFKLLSSEKYVKNVSPIATLSPFIDPDGLLRSIGRFSRLSKLKFKNKYPIIPDGRHPLVKLFVAHQHNKHEHQSIDYLRSVTQIEMQS